MKPTITSLNLTLVISGFLLLGTGLFRIVPINIDRRFWMQNGPLLLMVAVMGYLICSTGSQKDLEQWGSRTLVYWSSFMPLLTILFIVMAGGAVITTLFGRQIQDFLIQHPVITPVVASLLAPTTNSVSAIVEKGWEIVTLRPQLLFFLQASAMMSIPLFNLRSLGYVNNEVSAKMYPSGIIISAGAFIFQTPIYWLSDLLYQRLWWK